MATHAARHAARETAKKCSVRCVKPKGDITGRSSTDDAFWRASCVMEGEKVIASETSTQIFLKQDNAGYKRNEDNIKEGFTRWHASAHAQRNKKKNGDMFI